MLKLTVCLVIFLFMNLSVFADCKDLDSMPEKLQHLRMEVACSGENLHSCQDILKKYKPLGRSEISCDASDYAMTSPVSVATRGMLQELNREIASSSPKLVNSVEEFYQHTELHRARVKELGMELYRSHPKMFEGLTAKQVSAILEAHDKAKVSPKMVGPDGRPFYRILYDNFGKPLDRSLVDALNTEDKKFMTEALRLNGVESPDLKTKIERLEKIADTVDRGMSHVSPEEFGRKMDPGSKFLADPEDQKLARELEAKYNKVTQTMKYQTLTPIEARSLQSHLKMEERFALEMRSKDAAKISARVMAHTLLENGKGAFMRFLGVLATKGAMRALMVVDGAFLFFANMDRLGCSGRGYHDWVKDPNCSPAMGLTPKVVDFLNEEWPVQKQYLEWDVHTCDVMEETYKRSITAPKILKCSPTAVDMELPGGDKFSVKLDSHMKIKSLDMMTIGEHVRTVSYGKAETVTVDQNGMVASACFTNFIRGVHSKKCFNGKDEALRSTKELLSSINYQIQKGIACCHKSNSSLALICQ